MKARLLLCIVAGLLLGAATVYAQAFPLGLLPESSDVGEPLDVFVWTMDSVVQVGQPIVIHLSATRPVFFYLFDLQPDGVVRLLYPNSYSPGNYVFTGTLELPDGPYQLTAMPPFGVEEFLLIGTDMPLPIPVGDPRDPFPIFAVSPEEAISELVLIFNTVTPAPAFAIGWHAIEIVGGAAAPPATEPEPGPTPSPGDTVILPAPPAPPPFPGQPGTAWYLAGGGWFPGIPTHGWYWYFGLEGSWHLCLAVD